MKQPSDRIRMLINQLQALPVDRDLFGRRKQSSIERAIELINQIAKSGEWPSVIYLVPYLTAPEQAIAKSAGNGIEVLLEGIRPSLLLQLDDRLRGGLWSVPIYLSRWDAIKFSSLDKSISEKTQVGVVGMASFHRNGYVREAALKRLSDVSNGNELPFLLIRLSDWVPQVRLVAEHAVEQRINPEYLRHFVDNLSVLERVRQRQRGASVAQRFELIERVTSMLKQSQNGKLLLDGLQHKDYEVRRTCLKLLMDSKEPDSAEIISRIIRDRDVTNRRAAVELSLNLSSRERLSLLKQLVMDRAPSLRRDALSALCEATGDEHIEHLKAALIDTSAVVRDYARWKLAKLETNFEFREFYIQQLQCSKTGRILAAAAAGLGETGKLADAQVVLTLIDHPEVRVKKAAIRALARLDAGNYTEAFLRLLGNDMPDVSCTAQNALEQTINIVSSDSLWNVLTTTSLWHAKRNVLRLLNQIDKWDRISYLLLAASQDDVRVRELAMKYIESWERQYRTTWQYTKPTAEQQEKFVSGMLSMSSVLSDQLRDTLQQCLKAYT